MQGTIVKAVMKAIEMNASQSWKMFISNNAIRAAFQRNLKMSER